MQIGYLHRGFEKMCERGTWTQVFPYVDRLNYVSPMLNNVGFALAVEKLLGVDSVPERCQFNRVILGELARISRPPHVHRRERHGARRVHAVPLGLKAREWLCEILEEETGRAPDAQLRAASAAWPRPPDGFDDKLRDILARTRCVIVERRQAARANRIFLDRLEGIGIITQDDALASA